MPRKPHALWEVSVDEGFCSTHPSNMIYRAVVECKDMIECFKLPAEESIWFHQISSQCLENYGEFTTKFQRESQTNVWQIRVKQTRYGTGNNSWINWSRTPFFTLSWDSFPKIPLPSPPPPPRHSLPCQSFSFACLKLQMDPFQTLHHHL